MMIRRHIPVCVLLGVGSLLGACKDDGDGDSQGEYEPSVEVEANPDVDLTQYSTFDIVDPAPNATGDAPRQFLDFQIELEDAIVAELTGKGLTRDRTSPQLLVNPLVNIEPATGTTQFYESYYGWYWGYDAVWTVTYDYDKGSLVLDVVDRGQPDDVGDDVLVYRGAVHGLLAQDSEVIALQLRNATQAIFAEWPTRTPGPQ